MLIKSFLLPGVFIPALCAAAVFAASAWWGRGDRNSPLGGGSVAIGAAFLSAYVAITGWPRFPPVESTQRLFFWVAGLSLIAFAWGRLKSGPPPWPISAGALFVLLWGMLRAPIENTWSTPQAALWLGALLAAGLGMIRAVQASFAAESGRCAATAAAVRLAILGGTAVLLGLSGTVRLAQLMGAVACGVLVVEVLAWRLGRRPWLAVDAIMLATVLLGLLLGGYFYAELEAWPAVLSLGAVLSLQFASRPGAAWRWLPLLPLVAALALGIWAFRNQPEDPYDSYGWHPGRAGAGVEGNFEPANA